MNAIVRKQNSDGLSTRKYDVVVLVLCILLFFGFLMVLMNVFFPSGVRLADLEGDTDSVLVDGNRGGMAISGPDGEAFTAEILQIRRSVKTREATTVAWSSAAAGQSLNEGDSLQTLGNSGAVVRFSNRNQFRVGEKSLIVIRRGSTDPFLARRAPSVVMMNGELSGELAAGDGTGEGVEFALPNGFVRFFGSGSDTEFALRVNPDESSSIAIFSGTAEVTANGKTVLLGANEGITVTKTGEFGEKKVLPVTVAAGSPANGFVARYRDTPPPVTFRWAKANGINNYRLTVARDPDLTDIVIDKKLSSQSLQVGNLRPGKHYWTVRAVDGWLESRPTDTRRLTVTQDLAPPRLEVDEVNGIVSGSVIVRGRTEPGANVFVRGEPVTPAASGVFEHELELDDGASVVVVESVDTVGNVAYASQYVHSKPLVANGGD